jgi:hypothetical protein
MEEYHDFGINGCVILHYVRRRDKAPTLKIIPCRGSRFVNPADTRMPRASFGLPVIQIAVAAH